MNALIEVRDLKKTFNGNPVLKDVTFTLSQKENIVLIGKSGGGKSVLLKIIVGLISPDSGTLTVLGKDLFNIDSDELIDLRRKVGYVFQEGALYDSMTVRENVAFSLERKVKRNSAAKIKDSVEQSLDRVGLLNAIDKMPDELSGGMKKRVALARTLVLEPEIILYDEPTAALDPVTSKEIIKLILEMREKFGISSIIATHDMICAKMTADKILILHDGRIAAEDSYENLEKSEEPWIKSFFNMGFYEK